MEGEGGLVDGRTLNRERSMQQMQIQMHRHKPAEDETVKEKKCNNK